MKFWVTDRFLTCIATWGQGNAYSDKETQYVIKNFLSIWVEIIPYYADAISLI